MPDLIQLAIRACIVLMVMEAIFDALMRRDRYKANDTAASLTMGMGTVLVGLVSKATVFALFTWAHQFAKFRIGLLVGLDRGLSGRRFQTITGFIAPVMNVISSELRMWSVTRRSART